MDLEGKGSENFPKHFEKSSNDGLLKQSSITSNLLTNIEDMNIAEVMGDVSSASIIPHVENSQNETKGLELGPNQVSNTNVGRDVTITIEKDESHEESHDIINDIINNVIKNLDLSTID